MRKILFILIFVLIIIPTQKSYALDSPWEDVLDCGDEGFLVSKAYNHIVQIRFLNEFTPTHRTTCIKNNSIGAIEEDEPQYLNICPYGYNIPYNNSNTKEYDLRYGCCPTGTSYVYNPDGNTVAFCSARSDIDEAERAGVVACGVNSGDPYRCPYDCNKDGDSPCSYQGNGAKGPYKIASQSNTEYFYEATTMYQCNEPNCYASQGQAISTIDRKPLDEYSIGYGRLSCVEDQTVLGDNTCVRGTWYANDVLEEWGDNLGEYLACEDFASESEKETCFACYKDCPVKDSCSYSSLGCIQTTESGVVVRIFQIGLGVVGALAIIRFVQAALLRQTADPSKIQESYDIITSVVIGIVVLLGSMVILSFIGGDILQMVDF